MNPRILDSAADIVFFPVRHHSPTAALLLSSLLKQVKPSAVLIEGPSDYNEQLSELLLDHQLPIAIYSYFEDALGERSGAFYPFCEYSPEWQAVTQGLRQGAKVEFIDLPWADLSNYSRRRNLYSDEDQGSIPYIKELCKQLEVDDFSELWDKIIEIEDPPLPEYMRRCHYLCYHMRVFGGNDSETIAREECMANFIKRAAEETKGKVVVVTGGMHSYALYARLLGTEEEKHEFTHLKEQVEPDRLLPWWLNFDSGDLSTNDSEQHASDGNVEDHEVEDHEADQGDEDHDEVERADEKACTPPISNPTAAVRGLALTPYSYERLDSLTGYESGMPTPGFYHQVFHDRKKNKADSYRVLLMNTITTLRKKKKQQISSADLIAVETSSCALAALRGHKEVWRTDLIDGVISAVLKDERNFDIPHPFLLAIEESLRGDIVGRLSEKAKVPPLVQEVETTLRQWNIYPEKAERILHLELGDELASNQSMFLHKLAVLQIPGIVLKASPFDDDFEDIQPIETWSVQQTTGFHAAVIEASIYGNTLKEAAMAKLLEDTQRDKNTASAAKSLLAACLMGIKELATELQASLLEQIQQDSDLLRVGTALNHTLYLAKYDRVLRSKPLESVQELLLAFFERCLWLLDSQGAASYENRPIEFLMKSLMETDEQLKSSSPAARAYFLDVLKRLRTAANTAAFIRGASCGILWTRNEIQQEALVEDLTYFSSPITIGEFLNGLIALAKESLKQRDDLLKSLDQFLLSFSVDQFLEALPKTRLAFSAFSPRERHMLATKILKLTQATSSDIDLESDLDMESATQMLILEDRISANLRKYGLRGLN
ncbi:MAG: hypothetical protein K2X77_00570 [Candidatus Obscuribacterales bacterium]|jgi:hypothetical protein|nr:hypothetical protein [Candidatus Obscuribacterales bacterium]